MSGRRSFSDNENEKFYYYLPPSLFVFYISFAMELVSTMHTKVEGTKYIIQILAFMLII